MNTSKELTGLMQNKVGFTKEELHFLYNLGVKNFKTKNYMKALPFFQIICNFDNQNIMYLKALAGCLHASNNYIDAILSYKCCLILDDSKLNHDCLFYCGVCFFELKQYDDSVKEFNNFLLLSEESSNQDQIKTAKLYLHAIANIKPI